MLKRMTSNTVSVPASGINPSILGQTIIVQRTNPLTGMDTIRTVKVESYATRTIEGAKHFVLNDSLLMLKIGVDNFCIVNGLEAVSEHCAVFDPEYKTETMTLREAGEDILGNAVTFHLEGYERTLFITDFNVNGQWFDIVRPGSFERIIRVSDDTLITV